MCRSRIARWRPDHDQRNTDEEEPSPHRPRKLRRGDGFTIAASEAREIAQIAKRTVISDDVLSVLVPILEEIVAWGPSQIRALFESHGLVIQEWDRVRADWLTFRDGAESGQLGIDAVAEG